MSESDRHMPALVSVMVLALTPHLLRLPPWIPFWCGLFWMYVLLAPRRGWPRPGRRVRLLLTVTGSLACFWSLGAGFGLDTGVALLAVLMGIKPLEVRNHRDRMVALFLTYFLVVAYLFYDTGVAAALYLFAAVTAVSAVLVRINRDESRLGRDFRLAAKILVQSLPLMLVLFFLFPRLSGGLWGRPSAARAHTGFSDRLAPGSVTNLVRSQQIAFRVEFESDPPPVAERYWRGIVFSRFDGRAWLREDLPLPYAETSGGRPQVYTVTLEPHRKEWLFALDLPVSAGRPAYLGADFTLRTPRPVQRRLRYPVTSRIGMQTGPLSEWETRLFLQTPAGGNHRSAALARQWAANGSDPARIVDTARRYFSENGFVYSLTPPPLGSDPVDEFLFDTRRGYCEHFASAMAFLMRRAGIPARVVGGYLGGERNPYGDYWIVRQSDAHAWVEVWLAQTGWMRIDPTAEAAPERLRAGAAAALDVEEARILLPWRRFGPLYEAYLQVRLGWDAVNNLWNRWFMGYSLRRQRTLYLRLAGWLGQRRGALAAGGLLLAGLAVIVLRRRRSPRGPAPDPAVRAYRRFCDRLAAVGIVRLPWQGPREFARLAAKHRPDLAGEIEAVTTLYQRLRYEPSARHRDRADLLRRVRAFRPSGRRRRDQPRPGPTYQA